MYYHTKEKFMQKQFKSESLGAAMAKMILVVCFIVSLGALFGAVGYLVTNKPDKSFSCGISKIADVDGNIYNTVQIGSQCWLKENFKVTKNPAGKAITRYCYDNDPKICDTDGGLYDWNTVMDGSTEEGSQGICPSGWHIPKDLEWHILERYLASDSCLLTRERKGVDEIGSVEWGCDPAGTSLKVGGFSGFEGILTGSRFNNDFWDRGAYGSANFWSSTKWWYRRINGFSSEVARSFIVQGWGVSSFSVRCLKD